MSQWFLDNRFALYGIVNVIVAIALAIEAPLHGFEAGEMLYGCAIFALCSMPLLFIKAFNGRYALLLIFMFFYFFDFGGLDLQRMLTGSMVPAARTSFMTPAETLVLAGGVLVLVGYLCGVRVTGARSLAAAPPAEWPAGSILMVGSALWMVGTASAIYWSVFLAPDTSNLAAAKGMAYLGTLGTFLEMLGRLVQPLGLLMLAYGYARFRGSFWTTLIIVVVIVQAATGFIIDVKLTAMMGVLVVVVMRLLVDNRPSFAWLAAAVVFIVVAFPVYQAYRSEITGQRGLNHAQALAEIGKTLEIALAARNKEQSTRAEERSQTFIERAYLKDVLDQLIAHVGVEVPYLHGASLVELPLAFVPRLIVGDKQSVNISQLFNHQIGHSQDDTFISISHLGELYWNFGWEGTLPGMFVIGMIMGFVGARSNLENGTSLTRAMILLTTVQNLCITFEGQLPLCYVVWLRSLAAIALLHLLFARRRATTVSFPRETSGSESLGPALRFPNVMR